MAFRKFGGLEYNKTNNYVSSNTTNNMKLNISDHIGKLNTKIVVDSHLDLNNQSMFNVGNIYFANGADLQSLADNLDLLSSNNIWTGLNTFTKATNFKDIISSSVASSLGKFDNISSNKGSLVCNSNINMNNNGISGLSSIGGNGAIKCDALFMNGDIDMNGNSITNIKSLTSADNIGNAGENGQVITANGSGGWSWQDGGGTDGVNSITGSPGISVSSSTGDVTISTTLLETPNTWSSINKFASGIDMNNKNISNIDTLSGSNGPITCGSLLMEGDIDMNGNSITNIKSLTSSGDTGNAGEDGQVITANGTGGWTWEYGDGGVNSIAGSTGIYVTSSTGDVTISTTLLESPNTWSNTNKFASGIRIGSMNPTQLSTNSIDVGTPLQSLSIGDTGNTGNISYGGVSKSCYSSNLSTATLSEPGLYFGRNLGGDNEFNMVALTDGDTGPLLNIYASYQNINGIGVTGASDPILSLIKLNPNPSQNLLEIDGAVSCGQANYGSRTIDENGLYFCRNITSGQSEYDVVSVNKSNPGGTILNIYTSYSSVSGMGFTGVGTLPLVSMNETRVAINGDVGASQVQCSSIAQSGILTLGVTGTTDLVISSPTSITISSAPTTPIIVQSEQLFDITTSATITFSFPLFTTGVTGYSVVQIGTEDFYITTNANNLTYTITNVGISDSIPYSYVNGQIMTIFFDGATVTYNGVTFSYTSSTPQKFNCNITSSEHYPLSIYDITGYQGTPNSTGTSGQVITANGLGGWSWQDCGGGGGGVLGITGGPNISVSDNAGTYTIGATGLAILDTTNDQTFTGPLVFEGLVTIGSQNNGNSSIEQTEAIPDSNSFNQLTIFNNADTSGNTNIAFNLKGDTGPVNIMQLYINEIDIRRTLNLNGATLTGTSIIQPTSNGETIRFQDYSEDIMTISDGGINMHKNLGMNGKKIVDVGSITSYSDTGNNGATGQVITANGSGGWSWQVTGLDNYVSKDSTDTNAIYSSNTFYGYTAINNHLTVPAVASGGAGVQFYWNTASGTGATDLLCVGEGGQGGLNIWACPDGGTPKQCAIFQPTASTIYGSLTLNGGGGVTLSSTTPNVLTLGTGSSILDCGNISCDNITTSATAVTTLNGTATCPTVTVDDKYPTNNIVNATSMINFLAYKIQHGTTSIVWINSVPTNSPNELQYRTNNNSNPPNTYQMNTYQEIVMSHAYNNDYTVTASFADFISPSYGNNTQNFFGIWISTTNNTNQSFTVNISACIRVSNDNSGANLPSFNINWQAIGN